MTFELVIIVVLVLANGLFAMAEIALVSARKARLQQLANEGNARARTALDLANDPGDFLSTVQVGITLIGILAGALGGATIATELAAKFRGVAVLGCVCKVYITPTHKMVAAISHMAWSLAARFSSRVAKRRHGLQRLIRRSRRFRRR